MTTTILIIISVWITLGSIFLSSWIRFNRNQPSQEQIIDNSLKNEIMTHNWTTKEGIQPNTIIYDFQNGISATHDKTLNRLYVYTSTGFPAQEPVDTTSITVQEFEETLLGIEKR